MHCSQVMLTSVKPVQLAPFFSAALAVTISGCVDDPDEPEELPYRVSYLVDNQTRTDLTVMFGGGGDDSGEAVEVAAGVTTSVTGARTADPNGARLGLAFEAAVPDGRIVFAIDPVPVLDRWRRDVEADGDVTYTLSIKQADLVPTRAVATYVVDNLSSEAVRAFAFASLDTDGAALAAGERGAVLLHEGPVALAPWDLLTRLEVRAENGPEALVLEPVPASGWIAEPGLFEIDQVFVRTVTDTDLGR
jgi:hypothetical protein